MACKARQQSDQKVCHVCHLVWDMNDPDPPECRSACKSTKSGANNMNDELNLDPTRKHIVFVGVGERLMEVADRVAATGMKMCAVPDASEFPTALTVFERGDVDAIVLPRTLVHGWRTKYTGDQCDVHFIGKFLDEERMLGAARVSLALTTIYQGEGTVTMYQPSDVVGVNYSGLVSDPGFAASAGLPFHGNIRDVAVVRDPEPGPAGARTFAFDEDGRSTTWQAPANMLLGEVAQMYIYASSLSDVDRTAFLVEKGFLTVDGVLSASTTPHPDETCEDNCPTYGDLAVKYDEMCKIAQTNNELADTLLQRLAASAAREGILRDTVRLNLDFHNDEHVMGFGLGKVDSANEAALALPDDDTALKIVMVNNDPIEAIRKFNSLAGNTDNVFNVRQSAMYFGLQLEEMAEKMTTLLSGHVDADDRIWFFAEALDQYGVRLKKGEFDHLFETADRKDLLDDDVDQFVVTVGSLLAQGADISGALAEVNRANMAKVFPDGTMHRDANGKIVKPEGWTPPDLTPFVGKDGQGETVLVRHGQTPGKTERAWVKVEPATPCPHMFKSDQCRYAGDHDSCDKSFTTCCSLGNEANFQGATWNE